MRNDLWRLINDIYYGALKLSEPDENTVFIVRDQYNEIAVELKRKAEKEKMLPFVAHFLVKCGVDIEYWSGVLDSYRERNSRMRKELSDLFAEFNTMGIERIYPIENFAALLASGSYIALFASNDVDLLSCISAHEEIDRVMRKMGWIPYKKAEYLGYFYIKENFPIGINLMWQWQSRENVPIRSHFLENIPRTKIRNDIGGIPCLSNEELIYQSLVHASVHDYVRAPGIKLLFDIVLLAEQSVDWDRVFQFAHDDGYENRIIATLYLAQKLLDANIPLFLVAPNRINRKTDNLLRLVLESDSDGTKRLRRHIGYLELLQVESYLDNKFLLKGIMDRLFPPKTWLCDRYGENVGISYCKYLASIIKPR